MDFAAGRDAEVERERRAVRRLNGQPGAEDAAGEREIERGRDGGIQRVDEAQEIRVIRSHLVRRAVECHGPRFTGLHGAGQFHGDIQPVDGGELRAFRDASEDHAFCRAKAAVAEARGEGGRAADGQDVLRHEVQVTFHTLGQAIQNRQGVGRAVDSRIKARTQSEHRPGVQRVGIRNGHLTVNRAEAFDRPVFQRVIALARQREWIVEEALFLHPHATIDSDRAAHGVDAFLGRREDQRIAAVHHIVVNRHDRHDLRCVPVRRCEDQLRRHLHAALAVWRNAVADGEVSTIATIDRQRPSASHHIVSIRHKAAGDRTLDALHCARQRVTEACGMAEGQTVQCQRPLLALGDLAREFDFHLAPTSDTNCSCGGDVAARFRSDVGLHEERTAARRRNDQGFRIIRIRHGLIAAGGVHGGDEQIPQRRERRPGRHRNVDRSHRAQAGVRQRQRPGLVRNDTALHRHPRPVGGHAHLHGLVLAPVRRRVEGFL